MKVFYDGLGCIFTEKNLQLLDDKRELRIFLQRNTTKQSGVFLLPENVENRFNFIGDAKVEYLCFDDDSNRKMFLVFDYHLSTIEILKTDKSKTFPFNHYQGNSAGENSLTLLIDDGNSKTEPKKESTLKTENLLKLVRCMAIDKYDYDPKASRNDATGDKKNSISNQILANHGVKISSETIKNYLKDAENLIEGEKT